jgi:hypothetical protein
MYVVYMRIEFFGTSSHYMYVCGFLSYEINITKIDDLQNLNKHCYSDMLRQFGVRKLSMI